MIYKRLYLVILAVLLSFAVACGDDGDQPVFGIAESVIEGNELPDGDSTLECLPGRALTVLDSDEISVDLNCTVITHTPTSTATNTPTSTATNTPSPTHTSTATATSSVTATPEQGTSFSDTFDGGNAPGVGGPVSWNPSEWAIINTNRDPRQLAWTDPHLDAVLYGDHGPNCEPPAADGSPPVIGVNTHLIDRFMDWSYLCGGGDGSHLMMTGGPSSGYSLTIATADFLADWENEPVTISVDLSTFRRSGRSWFDVSVTPPEYMIAYLNQLGPPANSSGPQKYGFKFEQAVNNGTNNDGRWRILDCREFSCVTLGTIDINAAGITPSSRTRTPMVMTISTNSVSVKFGSVTKSYNVSLPYTSGLVSFGMHQYTPSKASPYGQLAHSTQHIDNFFISNGQPFNILETDLDKVSTWTASNVMNFEQSSRVGDTLYCTVNSVTPQARFMDSQGVWGSWMNMTNRPMKNSNTARLLDREISNVPADSIAVEFRSLQNSWHGRYMFSNCMLLPTVN